MDKYKIYCNVDFLVHFFNQKPSSDEMFESSDFQNWLSVGMIIFKYSHLIIDKDRQTLVRLSKDNPLIFELIDSINKGGSEIEYLPEEYDKMDDDYFNFKTNEIFLLNKTEEECKNLEEKYGLFFVSTDKLEKVNFLIKSEIVQIKKSEKYLYGWGSIHNLKHTFNAMIIADNYILKDSFAYNNLIDLFNTLMPKKLRNIPFHLTIITQKNHYNEDLKKILSNLDSFLKNQFEYNIELSIILFNYKSDFHDRNIITNYSWISSGAGFDLFKNKKSKYDTQIKFYPLTTLLSNPAGNSILEIYNNLQAQFKKINRKEKDNGVVDYAGSKKNRLLN